VTNKVRAELAVVERKAAKPEDNEIISDLNNQDYRRFGDAPPKM